MTVSIKGKELKPGTYHFPLQNRGCQAHQNVVTSFREVDDLPKGAGGFLEVKTYDVTHRPDGTPNLRHTHSTFVDIPPGVSRGTSDGSIEGVRRKVPQKS